MIKRIRNNKTSQKILFLLGGLLIVALGVSYFRDTSASTDGRLQLASPISRTEVDRTFTYTIKDGEGNEISNYSFTIDNAELRDEIVVEGKKATSVAGRTFLVINLEIKNDYDKTIEIDTQDYFRLVMNGNEEMKLAPDIHNDPVEVQPISTKLTRIAYPVNDTDSGFKLYVGEINGDKETVELNLQRQ